MAYTVKQVAKLAGITVRALQHYDNIGLLVPGGRSDAGYRLYQEGDLMKLQQVMLLKEMGLGLEEIKNAIETAGNDRGPALEKHRNMLLERREALDRLIRLVDDSIDAIREGRKIMMEDLFDGFNPDEYKEEARAKYGATYRECERKTSKYGRKDWEEMKAESGSIMERIISLMDKGPQDPDVLRAIASHRGHITKWFYDCSLEVYEGLSHLYIDDPRFTKTFEKMKPGLAAFMSSAMQAYIAKEQSADK